MPPSTPRRPRVPALLATLALAVLAALFAVLVARPLATPDLWFHLKMGATYLTEGLWPASDPMLFTAGSYRPVQHEWLFGVLVHALSRIVGLRGLRVVHAAWALGLVAGALALARRRSPALAPAVVAVFVALATPRLIQFRPDLFSIGAAFALVPWFTTRTVPSWRTVALTVALLVVWANVHSLFAIGLALLAASALGHAAHAQLAHDLGDATAQPGIARRTLVCLAIALVASLLNPRGIHQLFTFAHSSATTAVWAVDDEWHAFDPFRPSPPYNSAAVTPLAFALADLVMLVFALAFARVYRAWRRAPSMVALDAVALPLFLVGAASIGAFFISIRFVWMLLFPLLYIAHAFASLPVLRLEWSSAIVASGVLALYPGPGGWTAQMRGVPHDAHRYLSEAWDRDAYLEPGTRFLEETGLSGRMFNPYYMGGFLGYRLAPRIRTFIDGRTEHYPPEVLEDSTAVSNRTVNSQGEDALAILDRRGVDLYFGVGGPLFAYQVTHTRDSLAHTAGWVPVFRSIDHAIYLRDAPREDANFVRVADYYSRRHIPFDRVRGFVPGRVVQANVAWAVEQRLVPASFPAVLQALHSSDPGLNARARAEVTRVGGLIGGW